VEHFGGKEAILLLQIDVISDITENMESLFLYYPIIFTRVLYMFEE
jgi:hypothetical protein